MRREAADRAKRENAANVVSAGMWRLRPAGIRFGRRRFATQSSAERRGSMFTVRAAAASICGPSIATPLASIEALCSGFAVHLVWRRGAHSEDHRAARAFAGRRRGGRLSPKEMTALPPSSAGTSETRNHFGLGSVMLNSRSQNTPSVRAGQDRTRRGTSSGTSPASSASRLERLPWSASPGLILAPLATVVASTASRLITPPAS
jgi:hypothetical protein